VRQLQFLANALVSWSVRQLQFLANALVSWSVRQLQFLANALVSWYVRQLQFLANARKAEVLQQTVMFNFVLFFVIQQFCLCVEATKSTGRQLKHSTEFCSNGELK
jgi:hypothetical protein